MESARSRQFHGTSDRWFHGISYARAREIRRRRDRDRQIRRVHGATQRIAQLLTESRTVKYCGRRREVFETVPGTGLLEQARRYVGDQGVGVMLEESGRARYTHVSRCGSVWECPDCMERITASRREDLMSLVSAHRIRGGGVYLLTVTVPHDVGDELAPLRKAVALAWRKVASGAPWKRIVAEFGIVGSVRALEVTTGPHGWHPHLHVLVLTAAKLESRATGELGDRGARLRWKIHERWSSRIHKAGYRRPSIEHGVSLEISHRDEYVAKMGLADELSRPGRKKGRAPGHRSPMQILLAIARAKVANKRDRALWREYSRALRGARQLTWSKGLRELYDLAPEQTELEIVKDLPDAQLVATIDAADWDQFLERNWRARIRILEAAEDKGAAGVLAQLDQLRGLPPVPF
jgi:hypothetical protein